MSASKELLDLVDENDTIIGEVLRGEANSNPKLLHREIGVLLYCKNRKILFQKRSIKKKTDPGLWIISTAGHVPKGMGPKEAAIVEVYEELGIKADLRFVEKYLFTYPNESHFAYFYTGEISPDSTFKIDYDEASEVRFLSNSEVEDMILKGEQFEKHSLDSARKFWLEVKKTAKEIP